MAEAPPGGWSSGQAEAAPDQTWLVDMVIQFMSSPNWSEPVQGFITDNCVRFDDFQEEMKHEYIEVHNEFKNLVDSLLTAHLLEVDVDPESFEKMVFESGLSEDPRLQQVVAQLAAAEDFMVFKNMMIDRHQSLQSEAEANFKDVEEQVRRVAEAAEFAEAIAAAPTPSKAYTAEEERAFGASGGAYGRAQLPTGGKKAASNEKAAAIRKAILAGARPK